MTLIPYTGDAMPVHAETIVTVIYSDHDTDRNVKAFGVNWCREVDGPVVVAYEVIEEYTPPKESREWFAVGGRLYASWGEAALFRRRCEEQGGPHHLETPIVRMIEAGEE